MKFNFRVVQVNRLKWRDFLKHENPVAAALMSKMRMAKAERTQVKYECLRLMLTLKLDPAKMQMIAGFVNTYLRLKPEEELWVESEIKKLDPTGEKVMQVTTYWEERGLQQGLQQMALLLLESKFGSEFDPVLQDRVKALPIALLQDLGRSVLRFSKLSDLLDWLKQREEMQS